MTGEGVGRGVHITAHCGHENLYVTVYITVLILCMPWIVLMFYKYTDNYIPQLHITTIYLT